MQKQNLKHKTNVFSKLLPSSCSSYSSSSLPKHVNRIVMFGKNQVPPPLQIRSFSKNKVFEDQSEGLICYRDENGEMVCEGYDEGPRFRQRTFCQLRDAEILDLLQDRWLQIVNGVNGF